VASDSAVLTRGSRGSGNGQFRESPSPLGIAVASSGNVSVTDGGNSRVQVFDSQGNFIRTWGSFGSVVGGGNGLFDLPAGVAIGPSGNVFVVDGGNERVQVFDSQGNFIRKWGSPNGSGNGQFEAPWGVAADPSGNVFVAEAGNTRIQVFDTQGNFIRKWGSNGSGNGQFKFDGPWGVAVGGPSGSVFVADSLNDRIQVFDPQGNFLRKWGSEGSGSGQFDFPYGIAVDDSGNAYVADTENHRIQKYRLISGPDTAVSSPRVSAKKKQTQKGSAIKVKVKFGSAEQVTAKATGTVVVAAGGARVSGTRTYKLKRQVKRNDPGSTEVLKLKPKKKDAKKIAKALEQGKKAKAKLKVKLTDEAGNKKTKKLAVKLK
jgi:DNA-binding beta-propeller fold protein YncE